MWKVRCPVGLELFAGLPVSEQRQGEPQMETSTRIWEMYQQEQKDGQVEDQEQLV